MKIIHLIFLPLLLVGCVTGSNPQQSTALPPRHGLPEVQTERLTPPEGSIFSAHATDLYRDRRAHKVGDIVLVDIIENTSAKNKANTNTKRNSSVKGNITNIFSIADWMKFTAPGANDALSVSLTNDFKGEGETKRDSSATATISARIIEVTMDGNLLIQGYREVRINNETQFIIISGLVRPDDVSPNNSVKSTHIANARIELSGTGVISDKQQPGWLARGVDMVWPF